MPAAAASTRSRRPDLAPDPSIERDTAARRSLTLAHLQRTAGNRAVVQRIYGVHGVHLPNEGRERKRILLYGCGDFSRARAYVEQVLAVTHQDELLGASVELVATEIRSPDELRLAYGDRAATNIAALEARGASVRYGIDATNHAQFGSFDEILFEGLHGGVYGKSIQQSGQVLVANWNLLKGVLEGASEHIAPKGRLVLTVSGWPFLPRPNELSLGSFRLDLPDKAQSIANEVTEGCWQLVETRKISITVTQTNGGTFESDNGRRIVFEDDRKWRDEQLLLETVRGYYFYRSPNPPNYPPWVRDHPKLANVEELVRIEDEARYGGANDDDQEMIEVVLAPIGDDQMAD